MKTINEKIQILVDKKENTEENRKTEKTNFEWTALMTIEEIQKKSTWMQKEALSD